MLAFDDALCGAIGEYFDNSQEHMAARMVRHRGQGFGQLRFRRSEGCHGIGHKGICALESVHACRTNKRVDIVGIDGERAIEKASRLRDTVRGAALIEPSQTLKIEIHRVGGRRLFRASRLGGGELGLQRASQARDDFVLHVEEIGKRLVEPLCQQGFRLFPVVLPASPSGMPSRALDWSPLAMGHLLTRCLPNIGLGVDLESQPLRLRLYRAVTCGRNEAWLLKPSRRSARH